MGHHLKPEEPLYETAAVLSYEAGRVLELAMYLHWGEASSDERTKKTVLGQLKSDLIDIGAQFVLLCEQVDVDPQDMIKEGMEKAVERFTRKEYRYFNLEREEDNANPSR